MRNLYLITINDSKGMMRQYGIVAPTKAKAETEAQRLAGVAADVEPHTSQLFHKGIDSEVE